MKGPLHSLLSDTRVQRLQIRLLQLQALHYLDCPLSPLHSVLILLWNCALFRMRSDLPAKETNKKKQDLSGVLLSKRCLIHWVLKVRDEGCGAVIQKIWLTPDVMHVTRLRIYVEFYSAMHSEFLVYVMVLTLVTCMPGHRYTCRETSFLHSFMLCTTNPGSAIWTSQPGVTEY